jgi:hypothetical protein
MRASFAVLLALGLCSAAPYAHSQASPAAKASVVPDTSVSRGTGHDITLRPTPNQRQVKPEQVVQAPTYYAATLPVVRDEDGRISITVVLNPKTHSVQKLDALLASFNKAVTYRQFGEGIGRYDAPTGRYYFSTMYQTIRKLPNGYTDNGPLRVITGWVEPDTSQAAVADEAFPN